MMYRLTDDLRIAGLRPLIPPAILMEEIPITERASTVVAEAREDATRIVRGADDRLLVVAGPCSIHDPAAALEYARRLHAERERHSDALCVVMRVYFEKPRTTVGWKGLINDPGLDGSFDINRGLRLARKLLVDLGELGIPVGSEFLDTISPQFVADLELTNTRAHWAAPFPKTNVALRNQVQDVLNCMKKDGTIAKLSEKWFGRVPPPDAIFCGNDQIARGVCDALRERGIVVPDAVSVVGFDNWEIIAEATRPPLTTVDMNLVELGRAAGSHLIRLIAGAAGNPYDADVSVITVITENCEFPRWQTSTARWRCSDWRIAPATSARGRMLAGL